MLDPNYDFGEASARWSVLDPSCDFGEGADRAWPLRAESKGLGTVLASILDGAALFRAHGGFVAGFLCRLGVGQSELDDAVQEVFLVAHRCGGFKVGDAQPTTWLAEIALRVASGQKRSLRRRVQRETDVASDDVEHATPFDTLAKREARDRITLALDTLSLEHRAVFILFEIEEESCESIAEGLGIPIGTVYSRLHNARERFKKAYDRLLAEPSSAASYDQKGTL